VNWTAAVDVPFASDQGRRVMAVLDASPGDGMQTITKKELIDRIAEKSSHKRVVVKGIVQMFLDEIIDELGQGNRLEFRDFGVFESKLRAARTAQNPKTLERVSVPSKRTVKFKVGRLMKLRLSQAKAQAQTQEHAK
jgi:integration host factor subunit beta